MRAIPTTAPFSMQDLSKDVAKQLPGRAQVAVLSGLALLVVCLVSVLWSAAGSNPQQMQSADPNALQIQQLSATLEGLIEDLRELRFGYYATRSETRAKIEQARRNREMLEAQLEQLRAEQADLDRQIESYASESADLRKELAGRSEIRRAFQLQAGPFREHQQQAIAGGIPYKQQERTARLKAADEDPGDANAVSISDRLNAVWSYARGELRLARSSETYTARAPEQNGAAPHARYFRVGQLILGYVTEDARRAAMWSAGPAGSKWRTVTDPGKADRLQTAVAILDRRQAPQLIMLPLNVEADENAIAEGR